MLVNGDRGLGANEIAERYDRQLSEALMKAPQ
jgi:hypothetical protein